MKYHASILSLIALLLQACSNDSATARAETRKEDSLAGKTSDTLHIGKMICHIENLNNTNCNFPARKRYDSSDLTQIDKYAEHVRRNGDTLFMSCDNGNIVKLVNDTSNGEEFRNYNFLELNKKINAYVVYRTGWEYFEYGIVEKATGNILSSISYPVVSPNGRYFIAGNADLFANFTTNGLELYEITSKGSRQIGLRELDGWGPEELFWKNDSTVIIKAAELSGNESSETHTSCKALYIR